MASFPTSVFAPASRSNGQTIDAAHVNDVQDEIVAIEGGFRNGTAPLNSSGSTVATLSVTGGSTMSSLTVSGPIVAQTLSVTIGSTFAARPIMPPPDAVKVYLSVAQEFGSSNISTLVWTAQEFITNSSLHSLGTNPERLIPQSTGLYQFSGQIVFSVNTTGTREAVLRDSSGTAIVQAVGGSSASTVITCAFTGYKRFDQSGGHVVLTAGMTGASTLSAGAGVANTQLTMVKL